MGGSRWSEATYSTYTTNTVNRSHNALLNTYGTAHTADIAIGKAPAAVHQLLNPFGVTFRESRDSVANPNSLPIAVFFDVTGSMGSIPRILQTKLKTLMQTITDKHYAADPAVFFGAIGDATSDKGPLQVGQFESDIQMDEDLSRLWLEGQGGGANAESYELAFYFAARHFATDSWEKRQKKGFLFTIGDERPYDHVDPGQVRRIIGDTVQGPLSTTAIIAECQQKWHVFHVLMDTASSRRYPSTGTTWDTLLGNHVLRMDNPEIVTELLALIVGATEGRVTEGEVRPALQAMGLNEEAINAIATAAQPFVRGIVLHA